MAANDSVCYTSDNMETAKKEIREDRIRIRKEVEKKMSKWL